MNQQRLGILGAGRLGEAIAKVWVKRTGEMPLVWSRNGPDSSSGGDVRVPEGVWVDEWTRVLQARSIIVAIPGRVLLELAGTVRKLALTKESFLVRRLHSRWIRYSELFQTQLRFASPRF